MPLGQGYVYSHRRAEVWHCYWPPTDKRKKLTNCGIFVKYTNDEEDDLLIHTRTSLLV